MHRLTWMQCTEQFHRFGPISVERRPLLVESKHRREWVCPLQRCAYENHIYPMCDMPAHVQVRIYYGLKSRPSRAQVSSCLCIPVAEALSQRTLVALESCQNVQPFTTHLIAAN